MVWAAFLPRHDIVKRPCPVVAAPYSDVEFVVRDFVLKAPTDITDPTAASSSSGRR